jgi:hypothetical protein
MELKMLVFLMAIWNILRQLGIQEYGYLGFCGHLVFSFGMLYQYKSGNPALVVCYSTLSPPSEIGAFGW